MNIEFKELQARRGSAWRGWFVVDGQDIFISISDTLVAVWQIQATDKIIAMFLKQFGTLKIMEMAARGKVEDYTFISTHYSKDDQTIPLSELEDYLKDQIEKAEEEAASIGFKV